jgi:hypothetical protein
MLASIIKICTSQKYQKCSRTDPKCKLKLKSCVGLIKVTIILDTVHRLGGFPTDHINNLIRIALPDIEAAIHFGADLSVCSV